MALLSVDPGDIVAIPTVRGGQRGFVLSRIIVPIRLRTIEVFKNFHTNFGMTEERVLEQDFSVENRLFAPVYASMDFSKWVGKVKWSILHKDPSYHREQSRYSDIEIMGPPAEYKEFGVYYKGGQRCFEPPGVRRSIEDSMIYSNTQLMFRIGLHMSGEMAPGEAMNTAKERALLEKYGMDWLVNGTNAWAPISDAIATEMKEAQAKNRAKAKRAAAKLSKPDEM
ncbi:hypothetical protein MW290_12705 [Aquincola tertiaricarbonis]|uniref:Uncharacterized protein n=1 Tax=Aquincola tertiaricarbonis TaxID=391953 RepID=A0ABY4S6P6_AQUTE|nr:hypothetical protein [Aquincola tertiaricarbonis]URI06756.1 hypothetical protein MW290_12705 [Aquincola tertiaricarbonis]